MRRRQETEVTKLTARAQNGEEFTAADVLNDRCPQMNSGTSPRCSRPASKLMVCAPPGDDTCPTWPTLLAWLENDLPDEEARLLNKGFKSGSPNESEFEHPRMAYRCRRCG